MVDLPISQQDLANKTRGRHDLGAVGKHGACEHALFNSQVIPEQTLEHRAQIGGWFEVASLIKLGGLQSRLDGAHASASQCADWAGLHPAQLYEGRDLKPTTDLRSVLKGLLRDHLRVEESVLASTVFPDSAEVVPTTGLVG